RREDLMAAGAAYANRRLGQVPTRDATTRLAVEQAVNRTLEQEVTGSESEAAVQTRVDALLNQHVEPIRPTQHPELRQPLIEHGSHIVVASWPRRTTSTPGTGCRSNVTFGRTLRSNSPGPSHGARSRPSSRRFWARSSMNLMRHRMMITRRRRARRKTT